MRSRVNAVVAFSLNPGSLLYTSSSRSSIRLMSEKHLEGAAPWLEKAGECAEHEPTSSANNVRGQKAAPSTRHRLDLAVGQGARDDGLHLAAEELAPLGPTRARDRQRPLQCGLEGGRIDLVVGEVLCRRFNGPVVSLACGLGGGDLGARCRMGR